MDQVRMRGINSDFFLREIDLNKERERAMVAYMRKQMRMENIRLLTAAKWGSKERCCRGIER